jgi:drug/metabolite transporter (DMT)-like permease
MKVMTIIGVILIVLGVVGLIYGGISYTSSRNAISMGDMHLQVNETKHIPFSPIAGALAVLAGVILIVFDRRRQSHGRAA